MEVFLTSEAWIALLTLAFLEIVLGVDNIIFISIVSNRLPEERQQKARVVGLAIALILRVALLISISWVIHFTQPLLTIWGFELSGRDVILSVGGLFLLAKSTSEIHHKMQGEEEQEAKPKHAVFWKVITQIIMLDVIFSFDSILTAVGLTEHVIIMIIAVIIAMIIMMVFSNSVANFIKKFPTLQILALSFLILIGFMLIVESLHYHVPKGYIYFAVAFSLMVEFINIKIRKNRKRKAAAKKLKLAKNFTKD